MLPAGSEPRNLFDDKMGFKLVIPAVGGDTHTPQILALVGHGHEDQEFKMT